jgi:hypothetical protein
MIALRFDPADVRILVPGRFGDAFSSGCIPADALAFTMKTLLKAP